MTKCECVYATAENTPAVRSGHEMGGYLKAECETCRTARQQGALSDEEIIAAVDAAARKDPEAMFRPGTVSYALTTTEFVALFRDLLSRASSPQGQQGAKLRAQMTEDSLLVREHRKLQQGALSEDAHQALEAARTFIINGTALGYIRMPDSDCPDPAHNTLPLIERVLSRASSPRAEAQAVPEFIKHVAWLTVCLRTELDRLDAEALQALDSVEGDLAAMRATDGGKNG